MKVAAPPTSRTWDSPSFFVPAATALLVTHAILAVTSVRHKSNTFDEIYDLTAGYTVLTTGDFRLVPDHPHLPLVWAALPLMSMDLEFPSLDQKPWWDGNMGAIAWQFFYTMGNDVEAMLLRSRTTKYSLRRASLHLVAAAFR
jgi:hypothetical protein